jgi:transposase InsO family protein
MWLSPCSSLDAQDAISADLSDAKHQQETPPTQDLPLPAWGTTIDRPNQVWCVDITYIPMRRGFLYLVAIMDGFSRKALSWRLSNSMETDFCVEALKEAIAIYRKPAIMNSDQDSQFTGFEWIRCIFAERPSRPSGGHMAPRQEQYVSKLAVCSYADLDVPAISLKASADISKDFNLAA